MSWQVIRNIASDGTWSPAGVPASAPPGWQVVRSPGGPSGPAAAMDVGVGFSGGYTPSEIIPGPPALHPMPVTQGTFRSLSGAAVAQTFGILWYRLGQPALQIGTAVIDPATQGAGPLFQGTVTISATGVTFGVGDLPALVCPSGAQDVQLRDGELTIGGP